MERVLLNLARRWTAAGRRVTLVIGEPQGPLRRELPDGVTVLELHTREYGSLVRAVPGIVRDARPDLIYCAGNHYTGVAACCRLGLGRACPPVVAKVSNALVRPDHGAALAWGYRRWLRLHPRFIDHVVAMSEAMAAEAMAEMGIARDRVSVIPNPPSWSPPDAEPVPIPPGRFVLGIGRLEPQKRWDRLIAALPRLRDPGVGLMILGEGSLRGALEAQAAALGLGGRVWMPGYAADPLPAIRAAALVALTSDFEGVPGAIREALAEGTPVVSTEASVAVRELLADPARGAVVPRGDGEALVAALDHWLAPDAVRPAPGGEGGDSAADYLALFDRLVARRAA